jgi:hypothetical protein
VLGTYRHVGSTVQQEGRSHRPSLLVSGKVGCCRTCLFFVYRVLLPSEYKAEISAHKTTLSQNGILIGRYFVDTNQTQLTGLPSHPP